MPKILVIDDDYLVRSTIARVLCQQGYDLILAENGQRGLQLFESEDPDLVITDIIMPEREGIETLREMRARRPDSKIIAISGGGRLGTIDFLSMAVKFGADATLAKPFGADELLARVAERLAAAERPAS